MTSNDHADPPPTVDRSTRLITGLLAQRDPAFDPPPFDGATAEEILGASGRLLTPHRRLLELHNGGYFHGHALHVFGACEGPAWHSLRAWNATATWRDTFGDATDGLVFFAEDAFGDQYAYTSVPGQSGSVVCFEAELGRVVPVANSFLDWLEEMVERPSSALPVDVVVAQTTAERRLHAGTHLYAWPPLFAAESRDGVSVGHVDAVEAMRFRGELARQIRNVPAGTQVKIDLGDVVLGSAAGGPKDDA